MTPISAGLAIVGPTASGKTTLALRLAMEHNGEIISVDSRQVYRFLTIGTAKPKGNWSSSETASRYLVEGIPYHLVDFLDPAQSFSAADFARQASTTIADVRARGKQPILVGGTGLYFKALFEGLADLPPSDPMVRQELRSIAEEKGKTHLHAELARVDPAAAGKIPANNIQRVVRALEVYRVTGKPISIWHQEQAGTALECIDGWEILGLDPGKEELERRIVSRCRAMLDGGMIDEARDLLARNYPRNCPGLSGVGYPRIFDHLDGAIDREELLRLLIRDTRQYAKRQRTWFRNQMHVTWKKY